MSSELARPGGKHLSIILRQVKICLTTIQGVKGKIQKRGKGKTLYYGVSRNGREPSGKIFGRPNPHGRTCSKHTISKRIGIQGASKKVGLAY